MPRLPRSSQRRNFSDSSEHGPFRQLRAPTTRLRSQNLPGVGPIPYLDPVIDLRANRYKTSFPLPTKRSILSTTYRSNGHPPEDSQRRNQHAADLDFAGTDHNCQQGGARPTNFCHFLRENIFLIFPRMNFSESVLTNSRFQVVHHLPDANESRLHRVPVQRSQKTPFGPAAQRATANDCIHAGDEIPLRIRSPKSMISATALPPLFDY